MGNHVGALCGSSVCPKAGQGGDNEIFDDTTTCDPAGAVFPETLEDLSEVDRLLLTFSSSSNLAVVRWLFVLGANIDACDTNGTTCLHAACRSGSLTIVNEFIQRDLPLNATDVAGWTALHVALFMGRRSVALKLMRHGADLSPRNLKGLAPAELCSDVWLREAVASCQAQRRASEPDAPWRFPREGSGEDFQVSASLHFEPFFVPRAPVLENSRCESLLEIGIEIFNQRPGQGLAFLVATGTVRDFPVELSCFMMENDVSPAQVGEFLGEDFSLSQTLRLEYVNSVRVAGTGVVSCLSKVFKQFQIPSDLHKIDRIVDGIAAIWWRRHEQFEETPRQPESDTEESKVDEVGGRSLMAQLSSYDVLHQLMLSTVLLHWNLYAPLPQSKRISLEQWLDMNVGLDPAGSAESNHNASKRVGMSRIQTQIYTLISQSFHPELMIWSTRDPPSAGGEAVTSLQREITTEAYAGSSLDGWAMLVGGGIPSLAGSSGTVTYRHVRSILSEATSSTLALATPELSRRSSCGGAAWERGGGACVDKPAPGRDPDAAGLPASVTSRHPGLSRSQAAVEGKGVPSASAPDKVWLSLRRDLLFLASKPVGWAPYAMVDLQDVVLQGVDRATLTLTLGMRLPRLLETDTGPSVGQARVAGSADVGEGLARILEAPQLQLIFLLPDGRWQVLDIPYLQIQVPDLQQLERWKDALEEHSRLEEAGEHCSGCRSGLEREELLAEREATMTI